MQQRMEHLDGREHQRRQQHGDAKNVTGSIHLAVVTRVPEVGFHIVYHIDRPLSISLC